jgi:hypothetical protein
MIKTPSFVAETMAQHPGQAKLLGLLHQQAQFVTNQLAAGQ